MNSAGASGTGWPLSRQNEAMASGMLGGARNRSSAGLIKDRNGGVLAANELKVE